MQYTINIEQVAQMIELQKDIKDLLPTDEKELKELFNAHGESPVMYEKFQRIVGEWKVRAPMLDGTQAVLFGAIINPEDAFTLSSFMNLCGKSSFLDHAQKLHDERDAKDE